MEPNVLLIGVDAGTGSQISTALTGKVGGVTAVAGPADVPVDSTAQRLAIVPFFGPDTFNRSIAALHRRNVRHVVALVANRDPVAVAEAFRAGASDILFEETAAQDMQRCLSFLFARETRKHEPMDVRPLHEVERDAISAALSACRGQVSLTARRLGIGRSTLYRKIEQYALTDQR